MDSNSYIITNFILGATIIGTQGIRIAFNWDILNCLNNTDHSPLGIQLGKRSLNGYFDWMGHGFWCMTVLWWNDLKQFPKLKKWANAMSIISLAAFISMIIFNIVYLNVVK